MALFKISKGKSANLPTNKVDGYCYVTTNDHKFYIDYKKDDGTLDRFALNAAYADSAGALTTSAGSAIQPVYFSNGEPVATTYTLGASVPSGAKFTDTTYSAGTGLTLSGTQFKHSNSVTAATAKGDASKTLTFGGTFTIPTVTYDAQGHITGKGTTTMTMPANPNTDTRVTQTAVDASGYTNWRPLIWGSSNNSTEGFTPGTTTDGVYTTQTLSCQPSSGTIRANTFKGSLSGNAATATKLQTARTISLTGSVTGSGTFDGSGNLSIATTTNHTHNYAGSSNAGGSANSAVKLDSSAGSATQPIYFNGGKPTQCNSTLGVSISGNAATATKATKDGNGNTISSTYLPLSAGESKKLTGPLGLTKNVNYGTSLPSSGFTGQLFFLEDGDVSQDDLPIASATVSGIVTTGTQTFAGNKTFNNNVYFGANGAYGYVDSSGVHGAMWNDYAEFRNQSEQIEPGYCVASTDEGKVYKTTEKFQACDGIVSDTFGFSIGKTDECKTPLAVAGRVLAYYEGERSDYHSGDTVCAGKNGLVCKMTREEIKEYPDRIIGIVSEIPNYETWGSGNVPVNGRIWIKVK